MFFCPLEWPVLALALLHGERAVEEDGVGGGLVGPGAFRPRCVGPAHGPDEEGEEEAAEEEEEDLLELDGLGALVLGLPQEHHGPEFQDLVTRAVQEVDDDRHREGGEADQHDGLQGNHVILDLAFLN